jgi:hypothetical protein
MQVFCKNCGAWIGRDYATGYWTAPVIHVFEGKEFTVFTNDCPKGAFGHLPDTTNWE